MKYLTKLMILALGCVMAFSVLALSPQSQSVADYAVKTYEQAMVDSLTKLVSFKTVATEGLTPDNDPEFIGFKAELKQLTLELGLSYSDHGYVLLIGLGEHDDKLGIITHGDVQPANPLLWAQNPYILDTHSQPGQLIGRGTEDDKGAIVTAMYAMKSIKDKQLKLSKRIELMVYLAEESDWDPLKAFLKTYTPAEINITIDAEYPVVTAEKGWSQIAFTVPNIDKGIINKDPVENRAELLSFSGGYFSSQIPQQARATLSNVSSSLLSKLKADVLKQKRMLYRFERQGNELTIYADGKAAHSSSPEDGVNAVTHLAELLSSHPWPKSQASLTLAFIHELVGLGIEAEKFGNIAYRDDFMGPMTLAPTVVEQTDGGTKVTLNLRRPVGKTPELLDVQTTRELKAWQNKHGVSLLGVETYWGKPMIMEDAPHLNTLLAVFSHFTGVNDPQPVAIGGSTNSKLFPNALSFGPTMPGKEYTGHTENEFMTQEQFMLNLKMYTAAFIELTVEQ
ncbi:dipeptidase [Shewanella sp. D64]|uniref:dipeptidase n=1 Tax=unclassified Shewanella TaxID=196818 RepID=UPI0022BA500B|nr:MULTISPECIES: dipeptidase [unclassified Shewanella]MEC4724789.1 dipeptidase [Shewanella sp. D64]MEC4736417.1 dipeptidase [Shewanella sp. E94]WBJ97524.1 dipeptidase [Shewanella sp. MTB7]